MSSLTKDKCSMGLNPWRKLSDFIIKRKKWPENNDMLPLWYHVPVRSTEERGTAIGRSWSRKGHCGWTLKNRLYLMSVEGDGFGGGGSRVWLGGRRRSPEKKREGRDPIAAGMDQCSSWEQWGWLIGHHEGGSGFALPDVIGKQKQNCSVSQKIWQDINHSFVMLITCHKHTLTHVPFY